MVQGLEADLCCTHSSTSCDFVRGLVCQCLLKLKLVGIFSLVYHVFECFCPVVWLFAVVCGRAGDGHSCGRSGGYRIGHRIGHARERCMDWL